MQKLQNVLTLWVPVYFLITGLCYGLNEWLISMPIYLRTLLLSAIMVLGIQYMIIPGLQLLKRIRIKSIRK